MNKKKSSRPGLVAALAEKPARADVYKQEQEKVQGQHNVQTRAPVQNSGTRVRQIVLYGRPASGKTCYLAALAMPREPHPLGYSCQWVRDSQTIVTPQGSREDWDRDDPQVARYLGKEWLHRAIEAIEGGGLPRANPNDTAPFRLFFDVTQTSGRIQRAELIDYSGELVDPEQSDQELAKKLLNHLDEADGILVLAEAPKPGEKYYELHRELHNLRQALMLVNEKRRQRSEDPVPIALVLNKWDRYTKMTEYDPAIAHMEVMEFIDQKPVVPQKGLYNELQGVAGKLEQTTFATLLPASAFGKTRRVNKIVDGKEKEVEVPAETAPLPSYGLEDALVWVCERADQLDLHKLAKSVNGLAWWKIWQFRSRKALAVAAQVVATSKGIPKHLPEAKELANLAATAKKRYLQQGASFVTACVVLVFALIQAGYGVYDGFGYAQADELRIEIEAGADPMALNQDNALEKSVGFLASYCKPAWFRWGSQYFMLWPSTAEKYHESLRAGLEKANHHVAVVAEMEAKIENLVQAAEQAHDPAKIQEFLHQLQTLEMPAEKTVADRLGDKREIAIARIQQRLAAVENQAGSDRVNNEYNEKMRNCYLPEAVALLIKHKAAQADKVAELEVHFKNNWFPGLHRKVVELAKNNQWQPLDSLLRTVREDRGITDLVGFRELAERVDKETEKVKKWRALVAYRDFHANPGISSYRKVVKDFGTEAHKETVIKWEEFQDYLETPQHWTLKVTRFATSNTGGTFGSTDYQLSAWIGNRKIASGTFAGEKGSVDLPLNMQSQEVTAKPNSVLEFYIHGTTTNWFTNIAFSGNLSGDARHLTEASNVTIRSSNNSYPNPTIRVKLEPVGFIPLAEPQLPKPEDPAIQ